jgi:hypothetical protein
MNGNISVLEFSIIGAVNVKYVLRETALSIYIRTKKHLMVVGGIFIYSAKTVRLDAKI